MGLAILGDRLGESRVNSDSSLSANKEALWLKLDEKAAAPIRDIMGRYYGDYLRRARKKRWCDKSLDNYKYAFLFSQVFPEAQFICLYRHCMDVIASGLEACPWGLDGFGFEEHAELFPSNSVAAIGNYWLTTTRAILEFERENQHRCLGVRYEDLVTEPDQVAAKIFSFLGVERIAGITEKCLRDEHDAHGPSDYKIWFTDRISTASVGRGVRVPPRRLPPPLLDGVNETPRVLGYRIVTRAWSEIVDGFDPRADAVVAGRAAGRATRPAEPEDAVAAQEDDVLTAISSRLTSAEHAEITARWPSLGGVTALIAIEGGGRRVALSYRFGAGPANRAGPDGDDERHPEISASARTWRALLDGKANMGVELKSRRIRRRHCSRSEVSALAYLLRIPLVPDGRR